jgi:hypothetical protein
MRAPRPETRIPARAELLPVRWRQGLKLLVDAWQYAQDLRVEVWDFAVELEALRAAGLSTADLRWLVCKGYVRHAAEIPAGGKEGRAFRPLARLTVTEETCFVLTEMGRRPAEQVCQLPAEATVAVQSGPGSLPCWDGEARELRVGGVVVKRYRVPAENQELVLTAFEEEGWPLHIDDPLPPLPDLDAKRRLHDTINRLNRNQKQPLIRFHGHGNGCMVRWQTMN